MKNITIVFAFVLTSQLVQAQSATLKAAIKTFVATNYAGYKVSKPSSDPLCAGGVAFEVLVSKKGAMSVPLIFDEKGNYVQKEQDIRFKGAPQAVRTYLDIHYKNSKMPKTAEKLTLADNKTVQYQFDITTAGKTKEVIVSEAGTLVCEEK